MIRSQLFSRLPANKKEYYFLRRSRLEYQYISDPLIFCTSDKEEVFKMLKVYEDAGVSCYVEDREGKRLS
jgi:hypothetical protein